MAAGAKGHGGGKYINSIIVGTATGSFATSGGGEMETTNVARFVDHADPKRYHRE